MNIVVCYTQHIWKSRVVESYARSIVNAFEARGHTILSVGIGHEFETLESLPAVDAADHILEIEGGRDEKGDFNYLVPTFKDNLPKGQKGKNGPLPPCSVRFVDDHGHPSLHKRLAGHYDHVFFAVYSRRALYEKHPSAHFVPSGVDPRFFYPGQFQLQTEIKYDFGFFGSKHGLDRADPLEEICKKNKWRYRICQINRPSRHMWPHTGEAMAECFCLFNRGQKHDLNQRLFESMAMGAPLINDLDPKSGITKLFKPYEHFRPYETYTYEGLEEQCHWVEDNQEEAMEMGLRAYKEVMDKHTIVHRVGQMLDVWS